ncbi:MAG: DUF4040 domain-containing protein [Clostridiales bacterium]|nr:DUF4040 domain-containing protein [Clostridiales bacterium]
MELIIILSILIIQIVLTVAIIFQKNLYFSVLYMAITSILSSVLFIIFNAPDIALAEISVGSTLIPFVYIISITKQKEFVVMDESKDPNSNQIISDINIFCSNEKLKMMKIYQRSSKDFELNEVFRKSNIDVIIQNNNGYYELISKEASHINDKIIEYLNKKNYNFKIIYTRIGENVQED